MDLLCFTSANPEVWFPMLVSYRDNQNMTFFHGVHQFVWKLVKETLSHITTFSGPRLRMRGNTQCSLSHFLLESDSKSRKFEFIITDSVF